MSLKQAQQLAKAAGLIQLPSTPVVPTGTPEQLANLQAVVENAASKAEEKEKKTKEKIPTNLAINVTRQPGQGRQPQKIKAGEMPAFLGGFLFASASARVRKSETELQTIMMEAMQAGKMTELLGGGDSWQYAQIAPDTRTGEQWKADAPETEFLLPKMNARAAVLAKFDEEWEAAFGKEEETPAS